MLRLEYGTGLRFADSALSPVHHHVGSTLGEVVRACIPVRGSTMKCVSTWTVEAARREVHQWAMALKLLPSAQENPIDTP